MKTVTLTDKQWEKIINTLDYCEDEGPLGEGWQSMELRAAINDLKCELEKYETP